MRPIAAVTLLTGILWAGQTFAQNPLATPEQIGLDKLSADVFADPAVRSEITLVAKRLAADPYAQTHEGQVTLAGAAREITFAAVQDSVNRDATHPIAQWLWSPPHDWFGVSVPASKVLMPNVDNVFRVIPVDARSHYRITATPAGPIPTQFSIQLLPALPAEANWTGVIQQLVDTDITKATDGSFVLSVGPETQAQPNHIAITPAAHFILIRDTIQDWHSETPYRLAVTRVDGPPPTPLSSRNTLAANAIALVQDIVPRIQEAKGGGFANAPGFFQGAINQLSSPKVREGGRWGLSSSGHFHLADDEALVLTLDPIGAKYLSVQLASAWLSSLDYIHHTASLNLQQIQPNADGTVTAVIAVRDPGIHNWLDTTGLHDGSMFVRWQQFGGPLPENAQGVRSVQTVKISALPANLQRITPKERLAQQTARAADYARRFAEW